MALADTLAPAGTDAHIRLHPERMVLELDLSGVTFHSSAEVNAFFDACEDRIAETGETWWFILLNYTGCRIEPPAWIAFARRGDALHGAHSMGRARVDAAPETRRQIERARGTDAEDPELFTSRDAALAHLATLPSIRRARIVHAPTYKTEDFAPRVEFLLEDRIMEVNLSDFTFYHARDVDDLYDFLEDQIARTGRKWYFLIDYTNPRIEPPAWVQFARRGKRLNEGASLGSVRFAPGSETEADIRLRAESQGFRPNIRNTRTEALARIAEMKAEA